VARVARLLAAAGLVEAFGHVSARLPDGGFVITSTAPLVDQQPREVDGPDAADRPLETPLHAAIYALRPDVGAVCRFHGRHAAVAAAGGELPPVLHGLGLLAGSVALHDETDLVTTHHAGERAAIALGSGDALVLRANGALGVGPDLPTAAVRAYFLEERARLAHHAGRGARPLTAAEREARARHVPQETARAWAWLVRRFPGADDVRVHEQGGP
jgi:ribulose-5-phosphate 4-epimerase/fuculose-1-phosphate aldolase